LPFLDSRAFAGEAIARFLFEYNYSATLEGTGNREQGTVRSERVSGFRNVLTVMRSAIARNTSINTHPQKIEAILFRIAISFSPQEYC
jgi:hypothetical protein